MVQVHRRCLHQWKGSLKLKKKKRKKEVNHNETKLYIIKTFAVGFSVTEVRVNLTEVRGLM